MKEIQGLLKIMSDGLKTLAQGVEALADKVDDIAKRKPQLNLKKRSQLQLLEKQKLSKSQ